MRLLAKLVMMPSEKHLIKWRVFWDFPIPGAQKFLKKEHLVPPDTTPFRVRCFMIKISIFLSPDLKQLYSTW